MAIAHRSIRAKRMPDRGKTQHRKAFPLELKTLGDVIRKRRCEVMLKQAELAVLLQVTDKRIQAWERDEDLPAAEEWLKLTNVLGLSGTTAAALPNS